MDKHEREELEAAGFTIGNTADFLELTDEESRVIELRIGIGRAIRRLRQDRKLTQVQLAKLLKTSQARVARIELGLPGVSLDQMFLGLFAIGGTLGDVDLTAQPDGRFAIEAKSVRKTRAPVSKTAKSETHRKP
jgi:predicted XRE-type DNA-binding protein